MTDERRATTRVLGRAAPLYWRAEKDSDERRGWLSDYTRLGLAMMVEAESAPPVGTRVVVGTVHGCSPVTIVWSAPATGRFTMIGGAASAGLDKLRLFVAE